jgi:hypothetical protein
MIVGHYAPESMQAIANEPDEVSEEAIPELTPEAAPVEIAETKGGQEGMQLTAEEKAIMEAEVIRVQKVELSGLKVLGKIELPEPKKKETLPEATLEGGELSVPVEKPADEKPARQRNNNRKPHQNRERSQQRSWKNPIELQREREAKEVEAKKQREIEREKEKRKKHYQEKLKSLNVPMKKVKAKTQSEGPKKPVDNRPVPKTWFGKFLRWWTT